MISLEVVGLGTVVNVATVLIGGGAGLLLGDRLSDRTRATVTDMLGLATLVIAGLSMIPLTEQPLRSAVPGNAAFPVILLALLLGGLLGSALRLEDRMTSLGSWLRTRFGASGQTRFVDGFVTASLVFCVGPLAILGSLEDGLGRGTRQLLVKSVMDGFAAIAFASAFGVGVLASALVVLVYQGAWTAMGAIAGQFLPPAEIDAITVAGGVVLLGLGVRLLGLKDIRVADLLPALVIAPAVVAVAKLL